MGLFVVATLGLHGSVLLAATGGVGELPIGSATYSQSGLRIEVDTTWAGELGYRPIVCTVTAPQASQRTRLITIELIAYGDRRQISVVTVQQDFQLNQGETSCSITLLVPQYSMWRVVGWNLWVDGKKDEELSSALTVFNVSPRSRSFAVMIYGEANDVVPRRFFRGTGGADVLRRVDEPLPDRWLDYSTLDVVVITPDELEYHLKHESTQGLALLRWVRAGGNLWIIPSVGGFDAIPKISELLEFRSASEMPTAIADEELPAWGWQFLQVDVPVHDELEKLRQFVHPEVAESVDDASQASGSSIVGEEESEPLDSREWFAARTLGLGTVAVFRAVDALSDEQQADLRRAISQSVLVDRLSWMARHGTDPDAGNESFNDFLIPQIGAAPVTAFQVLLSLFVIGIGPFNYWFLRRREQLPLLLLTIPAAALGTIMLLFAYTVLWDGLQVRVRARSFTLLDHKSQELACWTRLSYYAGMAPEDGLRFPRDVAVYPINPISLRDRVSQRVGSNVRNLAWDDEQQHLKRGWLNSRTPTQYLTVLARSTEQRIDFQSSQGQLTANNQLGTPIQLLLVQDEAGNFFRQENLAPGEATSLEASTQAEVISRLRSVLSDNEPQFPAGSVQTYSPATGITNLPLSQNLMEVQISALTGLSPGIWQPGTYVAITDTPGHVSTGNTAFSDSASFHIIRGTW